MSATNGLAVLAIGGNALIRDRKHESIPDQYGMVCDMAEDIAGMLEEGWNVVVTHGNGPQVGFILRRSELSIAEVPPVPMDYAGADIQGAVGYMFVKALRNVFKRRGIRRQAVAVVTQTVVDRNDPAFANPTKPIGSHMEEARAKQLAKKYHWTVREDAGRGWRRVVPSPKPQGIIETSVIKTLAREGYVVVACGGGGIPVIEDERGNLQGVEAVIDKDLASSLLARSMEADLLVLPTGVEKVALDFNKPTQRWLDRMTLAEAKKHQADDQFDSGSMGPKIAALIDFVGGGGRMGLITDGPNLTRALRGETGTRVVAE
jgi:carbamate kinase